MKKKIIFLMIAFMAFSVFANGVSDSESVTDSNITKQKYVDVTVVNLTEQKILNVGYSETGSKNDFKYRTLPTPLESGEEVKIIVPLNTECSIGFQDVKDNFYFSPLVLYSEVADVRFEMTKKHKENKIITTTKDIFESVVQRGKDFFEDDKITVKNSTKADINRIAIFYLKNQKVKVKSENGKAIKKITVVKPEKLYDSTVSNETEYELPVSKEKDYYICLADVRGQRYVYHVIYEDKNKIPSIEIKTQNRVKENETDMITYINQILGDR